MLPLLAALAAAGVGSGYLGDKFFGDDNYSASEGVGDAFLGSIGGGVGGITGKLAARLGGRLLPNGLAYIGGSANGLTYIGGSALPRTAGVVGRGAGLTTSAMPWAGAAGMGMMRGGGPGELKNGFAGISDLFGGAPQQGPPLPGSGSVGFTLADFIKQARGTLPPTPEYTGGNLLGYMQDPRVLALANSQISAINAPHKRAIKERKRDLQQELTTITDLDDEYQRQSHVRRGEGAAANNRLMNELSTSRDEAQSELDDAFNKIGASMVGDESQVAELTGERENLKQRQVASSESDKRMAASVNRASADTLSQLSDVAALQSQGEGREARLGASKDIRSNRQQIADNSLKRPTLLSEIAKGLVDQDSQRYSQDLDAWGKKAGFATAAMQMFPQYLQASASQSGGLSSEMLDNYLSAATKASPISIETKDPVSGATIRLNPMVGETNPFFQQLFPGMFQPVTQEKLLASIAPAGKPGWPDKLPGNPWG